MGPAQMFKALRGLRLVLVAGMMNSLIGFSIGLWLSFSMQEDSEIVNNLGRMRLHTMQFAVEELTRMSLLDDRIFGYKAIAELEKISSALTGKSHDRTSKVPQVNDERINSLVEEWIVEYLKKFSDLRMQPDPNKHEVNEKLHLVRSGVQSVDRIVDLTSQGAKSKVYSALVLSICRALVTLLLTVIGGCLFTRVWAPYVAIYDRERKVQALCEEQSAVIQEQSAEIAEHGLGVVMPLRVVPDVVCRGKRRPRLAKGSRTGEISSASSKTSSQTSERSSLFTDGTGVCKPLPVDLDINVCIDEGLRPPESDHRSEDSWTSFSSEVSSPFSDDSDDAKSIYDMKSVSQPNTQTSMDSPETLLLNSNTCREFDGCWTMHPDCPQTELQDWLQCFTIDGSVAYYPQFLVLRQRLDAGNRRVYLEGGELSIADDILCRKGKSGRVLYWIRDDMQ